MKEFKVTLQGCFRPIYVIPMMIVIECIMFFLKEVLYIRGDTTLSYIWPFPGFSLILLPIAILVSHFQIKKGMWDSFRIIVKDDSIEGPSYFSPIKPFSKKAIQELHIPLLKLKPLRKPRSWLPRTKISFDDIDYSRSFPQKCGLGFYPFFPTLIYSVNGECIVLHYVLGKQQFREIGDIIKSRRLSSVRDNRRM